jgi:hypothetical protein
MYEKQVKILEKITENLRKKEYDKENTLKMLKFLIEESNNEKIRTFSIELMRKLNIKNYSIFKILENCLLSDESPNVRALSAKYLLLDYQNKCKDSIKWAIKHDTSPSVLKAIKDFSFGLDGHKLEFLLE